MTTQPATFRVGQVVWVRSQNTHRGGVGIITELRMGGNGKEVALVALYLPYYSWDEESHIITGFGEEVPNTMAVESWRLEQIVDG